MSPIVALMGLRSIGQAETTTSTSTSASKVTPSPARAGDGANSSSPSAVHGMAMKRLSGAGARGSDRPCSAMAAAKFWAQLGWSAAPPSSR